MDTSNFKRLELLPLLVNAAETCLLRRGKVEKIGGINGPVKTFQEDKLEILLRTPATEIPTAPSNFGLDVWFEHRKVFSVCWNSNQLRDYEIVSLKRGPWIAILLSMEEKAEKGRFDSD